MTTVIIVSIRRCLVVLHHFVVGRRLRVGHRQRLHSGHGVGGIVSVLALFLLLVLAAAAAVHHQPQQQRT
jgi:hypothetical protein